MLVLVLYVIAALLPWRAQAVYLRQFNRQLTNEEWISIDSDTDPERGSRVFAFSSDGNVTLFSDDSSSDVTNSLLVRHVNGSITSIAPGSGNRFVSAAVNVNGTRIVAGLATPTNNQVLVYERNGANFQVLGSPLLFPRPTSAITTGFGSVVAISDDGTTIVAASDEQSRPPIRAYRFSNGQWRLFGNEIAFTAPGTSIHMPIDSIWLASTGRLMYAAGSATQNQVGGTGLEGLWVVRQFLLVVPPPANIPEWRQIWPNLVGTTAPLEARPVTVRASEDLRGAVALASPGANGNRGFVRIYLSVFTNGQFQWSLLSEVMGTRENDGFGAFFDYNRRDGTSFITATPRGEARVYHESPDGDWRPIGQELVGQQVGISSDGQRVATVARSTVQVFQLSVPTPSPTAAPTPSPTAIPTPSPTAVPLAAAVCSQRQGSCDQDTPCCNAGDRLVCVQQNQQSGVCRVCRARGQSCSNRSPCCQGLRCRRRQGQRVCVRVRTSMNS